MTDPASLSDALLALLATYLIHSTLVLAGCWIALRLLRPQSFTIQNRVWKLAALAGFVTAIAQTTIQTRSAYTIRIGASHPPAVTTAVATMREAASPSATSTSDWRVRTFLQPLQQRPDVDLVASPPPRRPTDPAASAISSSDRVTARSPASPRSHVSAKQVSLACVGIWIAFGLSRIALQTMLVCFRLHKTTVVTSGRLRRMLDRQCKEAGIIRPVQLRFSSRQTDPVALGLFRWTVIVPEDLEQSLSDDELRAVVAHELAHFVRHDVAWLWIGRLLCSCFGFQPLNYMARFQWQNAAEYLCDQWAVQHGTRRIDLARCLTTLAGLQLSSRRAHPGMAATGGRSTLVGRVERLLGEDDFRDPWQGRIRTCVSALAAAGLVAFIATLAPRVGAAQSFLQTTTASSGNPEVQALAPARPVRLSRIDQDISLDEFESWIALDQDLGALHREIQQVKVLIEQSEPSAVLASRMEGMLKAAEALEQRRKEITYPLASEN